MRHESYNLTERILIKYLFTPTLWANTYSGSQVQIFEGQTRIDRQFEAPHIYNWKHRTGYKASGLSRKAACRAGLSCKRRVLNQKSTRTAFSVEATETCVRVWEDMCRLPRGSEYENQSKKMLVGHKSACCKISSSVFARDTHRDSHP